MVVKIYLQYNVVICPGFRCLDSVRGFLQRMSGRREEVHSAQCRSQVHPDQSPKKRRKHSAPSSAPLRPCGGGGQGSQPLLRAVVDSCRACLVHEMLLAEDFDVDRREAEDGYTLLMVAVETGSFDIVDFLINQGARADLRNGWGETALCLAVSQNGPQTIDVVRRLLAADPRAVNTPSNDGSVPLFRVAARCRDVDLTLAISLELIEANAALDVIGSNPDVLDGRHATPFEVAAAVGNFRLCRLLFRSGCDVSVVFDWMRHDRFPRVLRKDGERAGEMVAMATQPRALGDICRLKICRVIRNNGHDARIHLNGLGLPPSLSKTLLNSLQK